MPDQPPPRPGVMHDPRVAELVSEVTQRVGALMTETMRNFGAQQGVHTRATLEQMFAQFKEALAPQNRVVPVVRRDEQNNPVHQQTTSPQLLAELNDNIVDLITELQIANDMAEEMRKQNSDDRGASKRRSRRRR